MAPDKVGSVKSRGTSTTRGSFLARAGGVFTADSKGGADHQAPPAVDSVLRREREREDKKGTVTVDTVTVDL